MSYKELYYHLFNALTDAIDAVQRRDYGTAEALLIRAQQETEEEYLQAEEEAG